MVSRVGLSCKINTWRKWKPWIYKYKKAQDTNKQLIEQNKFNELIKQADIIITHGGVGSIVTSVKLGKKVIAVPRLKKYGEHVNDHQIQIVKDFNDKGYIIGIENVEDLKEAIKKAKTFEPVKYQPNNQKMLKIIEDFIG